MKALFKLVLRGSLVGAIAMATATGCGDDSSDGDGDGDAGESNSGGAAAGTKNTSGSANAGEPSDGGSTSKAGAPADGGTGGADPGTAGTGAVAGEGGAGGASEGGSGGNPFGGAPSEGGAAYDGPAIAKFCNTLTFDPDGAGGEGGASAQPTTMRLEIGAGNDAVTFTAATYECVPADGAACREIPTGPAVLINLFDVDDDTVPIDFATLNIAESDQLIFYTDIDNNAPIWNVSGVNPGFMCEDVSYDDVLTIE